MSEIQAITLALGFSAAILGYASLKLSESRSDSVQVFGTFLFTMSLVFVLGLVWVASQVAENVAPYSTWLAPGLEPFVIAMTWILIVSIFFLFFRVLYNGLGVLMEWLGTLNNLNRGGREKR